MNEVAIILRARQGVERINRVEAALGTRTPFIIGGADPEGMTTACLSDLMAMHLATA